MAIATIFLAGFEHGFLGSGVIAGGGLFQTVSVPPRITASTTSPRNGSYCCHAVAGVNENCAVAQLITGGGTPTKIVTRFAIKLSSRPASITDVAYWINQAVVTEVFLQADAAGQLSMLVGATSTAGPVIDTTGWHLIEAQLDIAADTVDWKVDGVAQTQATGTLTGTSWRTMGLGRPGTTGPAFTADYDDWIVGTWTNAATDWYGDGKILAQAAGADGTHATITSLSPGDAGTAYSGTVTTAYTQVDDPPNTGGWSATRSTTDNLALRVATVGAYAAIAPQTTAETGSANAVRAFVSYSSSTTTANLAACDVRNSAGAVTALWGLTGGVGQAYNVSANNFKGGIVTAPAAGWTAAEVNAVRFRFGGCTSADINPVPTVQALMLEVDWPVAAAPGGTDWTQPVDDTLSLADSASTQAGKGVTIPDTLAVADALVSQADFARTIPDTVAVVDAQTVVRDIVQAVVDTVTLADATALARDVTQAVADTVGLADLATAAAGKGATVNDTVALADALRFDQTLTLADTVALTDTLAQAEEIHIADTLALSDLCDPVKSTGGVGLTQPVADTVALADSLRFDRTATLADTVSVADATSSQAALTRTLADTVAPADSVATQATTARAVTDAVAVTDLITPVKQTGVTNWALPLADTVTLADAAASTASYVRTFADAVALTDALTAAAGITYARPLADTIGVTDQVAFASGRLLELADTLALSDAIEFSFVQPIPAGRIDYTNPGRIAVSRSAGRGIDHTNQGRTATSRRGRIATVTRA